MEYMVCCVPVSPMRAEPSHKSEMVSQQLFGEKSFIIERNKDWLKVQSKYDGYSGWVQISHVVEIDEDTFVKADKELTNEWVNEVDFNGHNMPVSYTHLTLPTIYS